MSFITEESGICLSPTGGSTPRGCGPLINEIGDKYVLTEEPKRILLDGECGVKTDFNCQEVDRQTVDSGKFVTLVNVCNLPLNITGLKNSDPDRFSIFQFPDYSGFSEYNTDNSAELPIKLQPFERVNINKLSRDSSGILRQRLCNPSISGFIVICFCLLFFCHGTKGILCVSDTGYWLRSFGSTNITTGFPIPQKPAQSFDVNFSTRFWKEAVTG